MNESRRTIERILQTEPARVSDEELDGIGERMLYKLHHSNPDDIIDDMEADGVRVPHRLRSAWWRLACMRSVFSGCQLQRSRFLLRRVPLQARTRKSLPLLLNRRSPRLRLLGRKLSHPPRRRSQQLRLPTRVRHDRSLRPRLCVHFP
jgi:hypothetical protein